MCISLWLNPNKSKFWKGIIDAFVYAVSIVVVAIPEGLPLAVTISLAYSTKRMYQDNCFIRVLAACETMGNVTCICTDKTGTLTENRMTVTEAWLADIYYPDINNSPLTSDSTSVNDTSMMCNRQRDINPRLDPTRRSVESIVMDNISMNRVSYLIRPSKPNTSNTSSMLESNNANETPESLPLGGRSQVIGSKTEGALLLFAHSWGYDYEEITKAKFHPNIDLLYPFNSVSKRSLAIVHLPNGNIRLYCKGAPEILLGQCTQYLTSNGEVLELTGVKRKELHDRMTDMSERSLRILLLTHRDYASEDMLPPDWRTNPPECQDMCCDCLVGICDPLREGVLQSVLTAKHAGVTVRMVTGDNLSTASAIATQCGILTSDGIALTGTELRTLTPSKLDEILPRLQVLARSSPDDKFLLVSRLNGYGIPKTEEEWIARHERGGDKYAGWEIDRGNLLPGYFDEWISGRPDGGEVVAVTGDGTNDAPALKAADIGLAMGITGTKVAQYASDIVLLDDKFGSIVTAIMWGRVVYDNIRKFLQFQLTANVVALSLAFCSAFLGIDQPINSVKMLWVNLIIDTMAALALGTELPTVELLDRRPYKRTASLISKPMWRNIISQSIFQIILLLSILFTAKHSFGYHENGWCNQYKYQSSNHNYNYLQQNFTLQIKPDSIHHLNKTSYTIHMNCHLFSLYCPKLDGHCYEKKFHSITLLDESGHKFKYKFTFQDIHQFENKCLECVKKDYKLNSILFNTFIFCLIFNEMNSRELNNNYNILNNILNNKIFIFIIIITILLQYILIEFGNDFVKTSPLTLNEWLITILLGSFSIVIGILFKLLLPVVEDPNSFFINDTTKILSESNIIQNNSYSLSTSNHTNENDEEVIVLNENNDEGGGNKSTFEMNFELPSMNTSRYGNYILHCMYCSDLFSSCSPAAHIGHENYVVESDELYILAHFAWTTMVISVLLE